MSSTSFFDEPKGMLILVEFAICGLAIVGNIVVLESVVKEQFSLIGYRYFLISLTASHLYYSGVNVAMFIQHALPYLVGDIAFKKFSCWASLLRTLQMVGYFSNLFNLCGMSIEHFFGTMYPIRYRAVMTKKVARLAVIFLWCLSIILGVVDIPIATFAYLAGERDASAAMDTKLTFPVLDDVRNAINSDPLNDNSSDPLLTELLIPDDALENLAEEISMNDLEMFLNTAWAANLADSGSGSAATANISDVETELAIRNLIIGDLKRQRTWCSYHSIQQVWLEFTVMALTGVCFFILIVCYGIIFHKVYKVTTLLKRRATKLIITTTLFTGAFAFCWLPFMVWELAMLWFVFKSQNSQHESGTLANEIFSPRFLDFHHVFEAMLISYPLIDPIIYVLRMPSVCRRILHKYAWFLPCVQRYIKDSTRGSRGNSGLHRSVTLFSTAESNNTSPRLRESSIRSPRNSDNNNDGGNQNSPNPPNCWWKTNGDSEESHFLISQSPPSPPPQPLPQAPYTLRRHSLTGRVCEEFALRAVNSSNSNTTIILSLSDDGYNEDAAWGDVTCSNNNAEANDSDHLLSRINRDENNSNSVIDRQSRYNQSIRSVTVGRFPSAAAWIGRSSNASSNNHQNDNNTTDRVVSFRRILPSLEYMDGADP